MTLVITHPYVSSITETTPSGGPGGNVGPSEWNANHTLTGLVSPAQGGTGITSGTGVTFFSSATVIADSGTLTANAVVLGGGANTAPTVVGTVGTTSQVLFGGAGGAAPAWGTATSLSSPAGSNTNVQFNNSGVFGGDANFTYTSGGAGVSVKLTSSTSTGLAGLSIATSSSSQMQSDAAALKITGAFNNSGTVYDAPLFMNIVNTASASGSLLADLQVGASSVFKVDTGGIVSGTLYKATSGSAFGQSFTIIGIDSNRVIFTQNSNVLNLGGAGIIVDTVASNIYLAGDIQFGPTYSVQGNNADSTIARVTSKVLSIGDGGANANGWLNWTGQARVTSNVTSTTTSFADITGMKVTLQASRSYSFRAEIIATCSSSGGIQVAASSTTTSAIPTIQIDGYAIDTALPRGYSQQTTLNSAVIATTITGTALHAHLYGTVTTTTTGASFKLQVAQQNLSATQTIVLAGSYLLINDTP